jgi:hypothetical protein
MSLGDWQMSKRKKYLYSFGVAYYPEKEMMRLQEQAAKGWQFVHMNSFGFLKFVQSQPQEKKFAVDFFQGDCTDIEDYLAMYEASGWEYISSYKDRYFYFQAPLDASTIFSDQQSYQERIDNEARYLIKRSFRMTGIGLVILLGIYLLDRWLRFSSNEVLDFSYGVAVGVMCTPLAIVLVSFLMRRLYKNRASFYKEPEKLAKRQRVLRDTLLFMGVGALIGGIIGFLAGYFY